MDLPWSSALAEWPEDYFVALPRGISRHIVRFEDRVYAIKEVGRELAEREYRLLRGLERIHAPAVEAVGVVDGGIDATGRALDPALLTRHLQFSLPYRALFSGTLRPETATKLLARGVLLVRVHLAGFFWGDCSLPNTLDRDADPGPPRAASSSRKRRRDPAFCGTMERGHGSKPPGQVAGCGHPLTAGRDRRLPRTA